MTREERDQAAMQKGGTSWIMVDGVSRSCTAMETVTPGAVRQGRTCRFIHPDTARLAVAIFTDGQWVKLLLKG